jgi:DNA-directed RNA polymerase subunit RPC12/RpoP
MSSDPLVNDEPIRTDIHCHECDKTFVAELDCRLDGNHEIECPYCAHTHYRVVEDGKVTDIRCNPKLRAHKVPSRSMWKTSVLPIQTTTAAEFIRRQWLRTLT